MVADFHSVDKLGSTKYAQFLWRTWTMSFTWRRLVAIISPHEFGIPGWARVLEASNKPQWALCYPGHHIWQEEPSRLDTLIGDTPVPASRLLLLLAHTASCLVLQSWPGIEKRGFTTDQLTENNKLSSLSEKTKITPCMRQHPGPWTRLHFPILLTICFTTWQWHCSIKSPNATLKKQTNRQNKIFPVWRI